MEIQHKSTLFHKIDNTWFFNNPWSEIFSIPFIQIQLRFIKSSVIRPQNGRMLPSPNRMVAKGRQIAIQNENTLVETAYLIVSKHRFRSQSVLDRQNAWKGIMTLCYQYVAQCPSLYWAFEFDFMYSIWAF